MKVFEGLESIVQADYPLGAATTYRVGGKAEYFVSPRTEDELSEVLRRCDQAGLPVRVLGRGSNVLVRDAGVRGAVIQLDGEGFGRIEVQDEVVRAGAAAPLAKLVAEAARGGLSGVECLVGIPGSVGGAVRMNAGGAFGDIGQTVERVRVMDKPGLVITREQEDLVFGYRTSNITERFILGVELRLVPHQVKVIDRQMKKIWIGKKNSQPMNAASAGCVFKNPRGVSAGLLIDQAGMKGAAEGGVVVSRKHANYIIVKDKETAKAADVERLIERVCKAVEERFKIALELEIQVWG
jgi:UDP-N-acetylmuramate dehydrogenase